MQSREAESVSACGVCAAGCERGRPNSLQVRLRTWKWLVALIGPRYYGISVISHGEPVVPHFRTRVHEALLLDRWSSSVTC